MSKKKVAHTNAMSGFIDWLGVKIQGQSALAEFLKKHAPSKGRVNEATVEAALREVLSDRYSFGTGFIVNRLGESSGQLDIVIYDKIANAPIGMPGGIGIFPIECVYATIEVKTTLTVTGLNAWCKSVAHIRRMAKASRYVVYGRRGIGNGNFVIERMAVDGTRSPRTYLFAFDVKSTWQKFQEHVRRTAETHPDSMNHGIFVFRKHWLVWQPAFKKTPTIRVSLESHALRRFAFRVMHGVQSAEMHPADLESYFREAPDE